MAGDAFPAPVQALLREQLTSFERLEIVLLLRQQPDLEWTVAAVSEQTRIPEELARDALIGLESGQLLQRTGASVPAYRFNPQPAALADAVAALAVLYRDQHAAVMSVMSMNAIERIRSGTMRAFADSFILGKRNRDG
jgi:hypothetical protein